MAAPIGVEFGVVLVLFLTTASILFFKMNEVQSAPYMDEIFHIPQAQRYCNGSFTEVNKQWSIKLSYIARLLSCRTQTVTGTDMHDDGFSWLHS